MSDGGKGSSARPKSVDAETFANNWDAIFGKKKKEEPTLVCPKCGVDRFKDPCGNNNAIDCGLQGVTQ